MSESLAYHAAKRPDHPAVLAPSGAQLSYRELADASARVARGLADSGVTDGSRVAYIGKEHPSYWEVMFACVHLGAVLVPVNWKLTAEEVDHILSDSGAEVVFLDADHPLRGTTGHTEIVSSPGEWEAWRNSHEPLTELFTPTPDTPMAQIYTSGTTGLPKGVVLAHRSWFGMRNALGEAGEDWIAWDEGDICLVAIPGFHVGGMWYATQTFNAGQTVFSMPDLGAEQARAAIRKFGITHAIFVPAMMGAIAHLPGVTPEEFSTVNRVIYGGAPIGDSVLETCTRIFGAKFSQIYGLTETGNTAICLPPDQHYAGSPRLKAAGRPYPGFGLRIVDKEGNEVPQGNVGEVLLRTPNRMVEYWNLPEATAETLIDGWIHTGDAGYVDAEGFLFIHDRFKDLILVGGENVFPAEVENVLIRHPKVADAAVIGIPDDTTGEAVMAFIEPALGEEPTTRELLLFLKQHVANFKLPTRWEIIDSIPRNPSGKILRRELRRTFWDGRGRQVN
ncbi:long-chain-fatty-acid--CoA ligase [Corynebacterium sp. TAE3-ERU12]|uniref:long-chain-fatty-acid--CoA ligase n=1 Tax=Corynebacterium sp. TAE3-ERU12 TaxID=2849491 RepID=UPI0021020122|nr:long-chain-fatty-acid--CoA ligase [Corynebacterium sp. TAE3-ERU12]